jgi:catechol-2,3-dioxygenase
MATRKLHSPTIFGVHLQVRDLDRSVSFYQNALGLEVVWNDDKLAVLHGPEETGDTVVLREIGEGAAHHLGEAGVTRLFWRVADADALDRFEERLTLHSVPYYRHREGEIRGIGTHDPDGIDIVLLPPDQPPLAGTPPAVAYWER